MHNDEAAVDTRVFSRARRQLSWLQLAETTVGIEATASPKTAKEYLRL